MNAITQAVPAVDAFVEAEAAKKAREALEAKAIGDANFRFVEVRIDDKGPIYLVLTHKAGWKLDNLSTPMFRGSYIRSHLLRFGMKLTSEHRVSAKRGSNGHWYFRVLRYGA